jgi:hypothetical protein
MSINQNNIADFITYLFRKRKQAEPPHELINNWSRLSNEEIQLELTGLFQHWGLSESDKKSEINSFLKERLFTPQPATLPQSSAMPNTNTNSNTAHYDRTSEVDDIRRPSLQQQKNVRKSRFFPKILATIIVLLLIGLVYKYIAFTKLADVYTITDNVSVRNENKKIVARMDLYNDRKDSTSFQKLKAVDKETYMRAIDNSDNLYPCRKVYLNDPSFIQFLLGNSGDVGYVNTNYVVDNKKEFELYQTVFKEVKNNKTENTALKATYRKVIVGAMVQNESTQNLYIDLHEGNLTKATVGATYGIVKQTIKNGTQYVVIAGLSDGNYYRFEGDVQSNYYNPPTLVNTIDDDGNTQTLKGAYRFINKGGNTFLYDCLTNSTTNYQLTKDGDGKIYQFQYESPSLLDTLFGTGNSDSTRDSEPESDSGM